MSYMIRARLGNHNTWFDKSYNALMRKYDRLGVQCSANYGIWEREYGFKIGRDKFGFACKVYFPSEAEATMFVLKWT